MSAFTDQVHITIGGFKQNVVYHNLKLSQKMADHHHFSFLWQYSGNPVISPQDQEKAFGNFMGNEVIFTFKVNEIKLMSKGKIERLDSIDLHGSPAGLYVTGVSHTIMIDDYPKSRFFQEQNMQQIALHIFEEESPTEFFQRENIVPTYTKEFATITQYNQTNFQFLKHLSARYGQWFYFDGMRMQLGKLKSTTTILINGSSLHNFTISAQLVSHKTAFAGYDYNNATIIQNAAEKTTLGSGDRFANMAIFRQSSVASLGLRQSAYTNNATNKEEIDRMVELQISARDANSIFYSGTSYYPIGIGQIFKIQNGTVEHRLLAIEVEHHSEVNGNYSCKFKAIPAEVKAPQYTDVVSVTVAETQSAIVKDNNDPEKLGRIKVDYYWTSYKKTSDWIRVAQNYSGQDRGTYFRPEIGDEVIVSFEGGNVERPYVSGSHYNGKAMPEFFDPQNNTKGWKLRFGQLFKFVEKVGIWLSDPSGNEVHLDEENKNINVTSPETITFNCKNFIINASESITTTAGMNISESAGVNKNTLIGMMHNINVGGNQMLKVTGDFLEHIEGNIESTTDKDRHDNAIESFDHNTEGNLNKNAQKEIQNNSGEQTRTN